MDELPQESWLNTHFWRWLIPQLYKKYPNMDMALDFACSTPPTVQLQRDGATANAMAELILLVKTDEKPLPVACISLVSPNSRNCINFIFPILIVMAKYSLSQQACLCLDRHYPWMRS